MFCVKKTGTAETQARLQTCTDFRVRSWFCARWSPLSFTLLHLFLRRRE